jgi:hypothetical protein
MKSILQKTLALAACVAALGLTACSGGNPEQSKFIESWKIGTVNNQIGVSAVFNQQYTIDGEAMVNFKDYGSIYIGQDDQRRFAVSLSLDVAALVDIDLQPAFALPTGFPFPSIVDMQLYSATLSENDNMKVIAYFGTREATASAPRKTIAALAIEMRAIGSNFPMLSITQNYFNSSNKRYASFSLYGPKLASNGSVVTPGGLFLAADVAQTIGSNTPLVVGEKLSLNGPHAKNYVDADSRKKLLKAMFVELKNQGVLQDR